MVVYTVAVMSPYSCSCRQEGGFDVQCYAAKGDSG